MILGREGIGGAGDAGEEDILVVAETTPVEEAAAMGTVGAAAGGRPDVGRPDGIELMRMQRIRELDLEQLEVEEALDEVADDGGRLVRSEGREQMTLGREGIGGAGGRPAVGRPDGVELIRMQRELDLEQLEVEELDSDGRDDVPSEDSSFDGRGDGGAGARVGFTFDTCLACLHTYLGVLDNISNAWSFLDGGAVVTMPVFDFEDVCLFPGDTLPLRVLRPRFKAAVERAMRQTEAPCTLGVIHLRRRLRGRGVITASVGTTAEIRQLRRLNDGTINVVARGRQRFRVRKAWMEADGAPYAQVQIIEEDAPLHIPRSAFGTLACVPRLQSGKVPKACVDTQAASDEETLQQVSSEGDYIDDEDSNSAQEDRTVGEFGQFNLNQHILFLEEDGSEEDERFRWRLRRIGGRNAAARRVAGGRRQERTEQEGKSTAETANQGEASTTGNGGAATGARPMERPRLDGCWGGPCRAWASDERAWIHRAQLSSWPHWVYRMYDAYDLSRRAADMLRQMAELPRMDEMVRNPAALSFYIASNMPLQDSTRQELLEVDGVVHRLRREIQLLESIDRLHCKACSAVISRKSNMLVMSADGLISAYVTPVGHVYETLTLSEAWGLLLIGHPDTANSWFPGYAWTVAHCSSCELHMGWRFTAVEKGMQPKAFWGVRRSQLAENSS